MNDQPEEDDEDQDTFDSALAFFTEIEKEHSTTCPADHMCLEHVPGCDCLISPRAQAYDLFLLHHLRGNSTHTGALGRLSGDAREVCDHLRGVTIWAHPWREAYTFNAAVCAREMATYDETCDVEWPARLPSSRVFSRPIVRRAFFELVHAGIVIFTPNLDAPDQGLVAWNTDYTTWAILQDGYVPSTGILPPHPVPHPADPAAVVQRLIASGKLSAQFAQRPPMYAWLALRQLVFERDDHTCQYCGKRGGTLHCDHIVPLSRGGTNDPDNLVTACDVCNLSKHAKTLEEWLS